MDGSKRKRDALDTTTYTAAGEDENTPKRRRSPLPESDIDADASDDATASYPKEVRRKKGSRNLSHLNLRHAAAEQQKPKVRSRKSRFIEGSMNNKPSEKPPSMFMRFIRTESGNMKQVALAQEDLMEEYERDSMSQPRDSVDTVIAQEKPAIPGRVAQIEAAKENKNEGGMLGKWASSLHPVSLWNKVFAQTREEMIREDFEEAERKAREEAELKAKEKANYEAQYQAMKAAGMFKFKPVGNIYNNSSVSSRTSTHGARDSAIVIGDGSSKDSPENSRSASQMSGTLPTSEEHSRNTSLTIPTSQEQNSRSTSGNTSGCVSSHASTHSATDSAIAIGDGLSQAAQEGSRLTSQKSGLLKSRLHLKKPSLSNISGTLKRAKSDFSLVNLHRESSSSISPVKTDSEHSALKTSHSKYDLKKQNKLSKRVSDLESKLSQARKELDDALVDASPMPKLGSRYERFTPQSTMKRPVFVPGKLPSLPSERILMAQQQKAPEESETKVNVDEEMSEADAKDRDLKEYLAEVQVMNRFEDDDDAEETIKARGNNTTRREYPTRASSLFSLGNNNIEQPSEPPQQAQPTTASKEQPETTNITETTSTQVTEMDPSSITGLSTHSGPVDQNPNPTDYATLDTKLKALEANVKKAAKAKKPASKTKKRKSGADEMDKEYKPGKGTEDDSEADGDETPKKKRKSTGGASSSPANKKSSKFGFSISPKGKKAAKTSPPKKNTKTTITRTTQVEEYSADEGADDIEADMERLSARTSFDSQGSQGHALDPLYEEPEEEEMAVDATTTNIPLNDEPSKPTAKATPARHAALSVNGRRSRSNSPSKRLPIGAEENIITRAAEAAKNNPARARGRSSSPPVGAMPGKGGVPAMPIKSKKEGKNGPGEFEWPDDVF